MALWSLTQRVRHGAHPYAYNGVVRTIMHLSVVVRTVMHLCVVVRTSMHLSVVARTPA